MLVPTTCGTGSEMTNIAILALNSRGTKKGLAVDEMYADQAVLIPELLAGLPFRFFATSSIDALIHAIESSLSPKGNSYTRMFGYRAIEMILKGYLKIRSDGEIARLNQFMADIIGCDVADIYEELEKLLNVLIPKKSLSQYGVTREELEAFTESVMVNQGRLMANNFVELDRDRVYKIYCELYE